MHALEWMMSVGVLLAVLGGISGIIFSHTEELELFHARIDENIFGLDCSQKLDDYTTHFARVPRKGCMAFPFAQQEEPEYYSYLGEDANHYGL